MPLCAFASVSAVSSGVRSGPFHAQKRDGLALGDRRKDAEAAAVREWQEPGAANQLYDVLSVAGLRVDAIEHGRVLCTFTAPPRLTDASKRMYGGAVASLVDLVGSAVFFAGGSPKTGVSLEITVSFLSAARANEIEIEARVLQIVGRTGCVTVEVRRKGTGEVIAHGRHTKYIAASSKL